MERGRQYQPQEFSLGCVQNQEAWSHVPDLLHLHAWKRSQNSRTEGRCLNAMLNAIGLARNLFTVTKVRCALAGLWRKRSVAYTSWAWKRASSVATEFRSSRKWLAVSKGQAPVLGEVSGGGWQPRHQGREEAGKSLLF